MYGIAHDYEDLLIARKFVGEKEANDYLLTMEDGENWHLKNLDESADESADEVDDGIQNFMVWEMQELPPTQNYNRPVEAEVNFSGPYLIDAHDEVEATQIAMAVTKRISKYVAIPAKLVDFTVNLTRPHKSVKGYLGRAK